VTARRIVVRPVHETTTVVPHELTLERDVVADPEILDARREIDVVYDQHRLP